MNSEPMCVPCVIKQCEQIVYAMHKCSGRIYATKMFDKSNRYSSDKHNEEAGQISAQIRRHALDIAAQITLDDPPSKFTSQVLSKVYELLKTDDPYQAVKHEQNEIGKKIYNLFTKQITKLPDPIHAAISLTASGNIIDVGPADPPPNRLEDLKITDCKIKSFNLKIFQSVIYLRCGASHNPKVPYLEEISNMVNQPLKIDDYKTFKEKFRSAQSILYILDNAGEIYLDKLLLERLKGPQITMVVKQTAILNDAMKQDAVSAGLDSFGEIISVNRDKSCRYLGVDFDCVSDQFSQAFESADIVIAKGHANFESLVDCERDCFFILMAKCPVVARKLAVEIKDRAFYYSPTK